MFLKDLQLHSHDRNIWSLRDSNRHRNFKTNNSASGLVHLQPPMFCETSKIKLFVFASSELFSHLWFLLNCKKQWVLFWGTPYEHSRCMSSNVITYVAHVHNTTTIDRDSDLKTNQNIFQKRTTALCVACQMWSISNAAGEL